MIYIIGNSHVNVFSNSHPACRNAVKFKDGDYEVITIPMGPNCAYNFTEKRLPHLLNICSTLPIPLGSKILLVVGEIDCRWHLPYQADLQSMSIESTVEICMDRFWPSFPKLRELGYEPCAWAVPPVNNIPSNSDESNPVFGSVYDRADTIYYWNKFLKERCQSENIPYYSIYDQTVDSGYGYIKSEYMADYCHLDHDKVYPLIRAELTK